MKLKSGTKIAAFLFCLLLGELSVQAETAALTDLSQSIRLGFIPGDGKVAVERNSEELAQLIKAKTGVQVIPYVGSSYGDLIEKIAKRQVDLAFLSALSFVEAESKVNLKVLLKKVWDKGFYYSVLLVRSDSGIQKLTDLKGKRLGLVDKNSGSGSMYPIVALAQAKLKFPSDFKSVSYSGSHVESVEALKRGDVDAIAVFANDAKAEDSAWTQHGGKQKEVRMLWASPAIPNDPLCVRTEFYDSNPKLTHDFMFGLIELNESVSDGSRFRKLLGVKSLMTATSQQYSPVRDMLREMKTLVREGEKL